MDGWNGTGGRPRERGHKKTTINAPARRPDGGAGGTSPYAGSRTVPAGGMGSQGVAAGGGGPRVAVEVGWAWAGRGARKGIAAPAAGAARGLRGTARVAPSPRLAGWRAARPCMLRARRGGERGGQAAVPLCERARRVSLSAPTAARANKKTKGPVRRAVGPPSSLFLRREPPSAARHTPAPTHPPSTVVACPPLRLPSSYRLACPPGLWTPEQTRCVGAAGGRAISFSLDSATAHLAPLSARLSLLSRARRGLGLRCGRPPHPCRMSL
jgi:hypothetical protein